MSLEIKNEKKFCEKFLSQITYVKKYKSFLVIGALSLRMFREHEKTLTESKARVEVEAR